MKKLTLRPTLHRLDKKRLKIGARFLVEQSVTRTEKKNQTSYSKTDKFLSSLRISVLSYSRFFFFTCNLTEHPLYLTVCPYLDTKTVMKNCQQMRLFRVISCEILYLIIQMSLMSGQLYLYCKIQKKINISTYL